MAQTGSFDAFFLRAADINSRAFRALDEVRARKPFFLFLNYMDAHFPYTPPAEFRDRFPAQRVHLRPVAAYNEMDNSINTGRRRLTEAEKESLIAGYDGGIAYLDAEIGKLFDRLRASGAFENTLIIVTSDHGEAFGEHNLIGHTVTSVFQNGAHIPLLVKFPRQRDGQRSSAMVSHVDLLPTVLDITGYPPTSGLQGRSLRSPRHGPRVPERVGVEGSQSLVRHVTRANHSSHVRIPGPRKHGEQRLPQPHVVDRLRQRHRRARRRGKERCEHHDFDSAPPALRQKAGHRRGAVLQQHAESCAHDRDVRADGCRHRASSA